MTFEEEERDSSPTPHHTNPTSLIMANPWTSTQSERDHLDPTPGAATTVAAEDISLEYAHCLEPSSKEQVMAGEDGKEDVEEDKEAGREEEAISNSRHKDRRRITSPRRSKSEPPRLRTTT